MDLQDTLTDIRLISYPKHVPKLSLIVGWSGRTSNALYQLRDLWDLGLFDVVIMEVLLGEPLFVAVHRFQRVQRGPRETHRVQRRCRLVLGRGA